MIPQREHPDTAETDGDFSMGYGQVGGQPKPLVPKAPALWMVLAGICLIALNLRGPIVAPTPILEFLRSDLGMSVQTSGLLTSLPVICFGLVSFLAIPLLHKCSPDQAIAICLAGVLAGTVLRPIGGEAAVLAGTAVIGAAIAVGNVVVPVVIRREFPPSRIPLATGVYTATLNIGSMTTLIATAPLAGAWGWRTALIVWGVLAVGAFLVWIRLVGWRPVLRGGLQPVPGTAVTTQAAATPAWRRPVAWLLLVAFAGQAFSYYGVSTWLPTLLADELGLGTAAAGSGASLFQGPALAGALGVPLLARLLRTRYLVPLCCALWGALPVGLLLAPSLWPLWTVCGGIAQGAGITIIFLILVRLGGTDRQAGQLSALVQGGGYLVAATGPLAIGTLHETSGGWTWPLVGIIAGVLALGIPGTLGAVSAERSERARRFEALRRQQDPSLQQPG